MNAFLAPLYAAYIEPLLLMASFSFGAAILMLAFPAINAVGLLNDVSRAIFRCRTQQAFAVVILALGFAALTVLMMAYCADCLYKQQVASGLNWTTIASWLMLAWAATSAPRLVLRLLLGDFIAPQNGTPRKPILLAPDSERRP